MHSVLIQQLHLLKHKIERPDGGLDPLGGAQGTTVERVSVSFMVYFDVDASG
jgi:hypothetical protein